MFLAKWPRRGFLVNRNFGWLIFCRFPLFFNVLADVFEYETPRATPEFANKLLERIVRERYGRFRDGNCLIRKISRDTAECWYE